MLNVGAGSLSLLYGVMGGWADVGRYEAYLATGYGFAMLGTAGISCMLHIVLSAPHAGRRPRRFGVLFWTGVFTNLLPILPIVLWSKEFDYIEQLVWMTFWLPPLNVLGFAMPRHGFQYPGSCVTCGYDPRGLTHQTPCPECGTPRSA